MESGNIMQNYIAGTITVPSRAEVIKPVVREFRDKGIKHVVFMDEGYKGHKWNISRMMLYMCLHACDSNVIITMDDILFKDGWLEKCEEVLENTDYQVITLLTNRALEANDVCGIYRATSNWWMYDHFVLFRKGVLNAEWFDRFMTFCERPNPHKKEINHYDNMIGHFLIENGYKCGIVRPNYIKMQNVKSILGHNIVVKDV